MNNKLGIIGGMGTEATSYFFEEIVEHTVVEQDQDHIDMIILNHASLPDRTKSILSGKTDELFKKIMKDIKLLEDLGVDNIAIPCNTSHYFYDELQKQTSVPIIHMVRESVRAAIKRFESVQKIGIMATSGTIETGVYHKECERFGVKAVIPSEEKQTDLMSLIYDEIKKGNSADSSKFKRTYDELLKKGSDVIILACTELSVYKKTNEVPGKCLDAMDVLVEESIKRSGASYQESE